MTKVKPIPYVNVHGDKVDAKPLGWVYFFVMLNDSHTISSEGEKFWGFKYVKIGFSRNLNNRRKNLQTGSPYEIWPYAWIGGTPADEKSLHYRFNKYRVRVGGMATEWFLISGELQVFMEALRKRGARY